MKSCKHSRACPCDLKRWASREVVSKDLEKLHTQAYAAAGNSGISQSVVTINSIHHIISEQNISTVQRIVAQLGGTYHGSIIVLKC